MVARLATSLEQQIVADVVPASEAIVQIEAGPRHIEAYVVGNVALRGFGLKQPRGLWPI